MSTSWWLEALKITEKIIRENAFEHKKEKPGLSANRPSNNWALVESVYEIAPKSLFWAPTWVSGFASTLHDLPVKKGIVDLSIRMKGNSKTNFRNSLSPLGAQNKDLGAALQTSLTLYLNYVISLASRLSPVPASACSPLSLGKACGRAAEENVLWGIIVLPFLCVSVFGSLYLFSILWFCFLSSLICHSFSRRVFVFPFWQMCSVSLIAGAPFSFPVFALFSLPHPPPLPFPFLRLPQRLAFIDQVLFWCWAWMDQGYK